MTRHFETLEFDVQRKLEISASIDRELMFSGRNPDSAKCYAWVDLEGEGSSANPLKKSMEDEESAELSIYLVCSGPRLSPVSASKWSNFMKHVRFVHVPDSVKVISDGCFRDCRTLSLVVFGEGSSVRWMGCEAFKECGLTEIDIPKTVEQICNECFFGCRQLRRITFHEDSSLKLIGDLVFTGWANGTCLIREIYIPNSVEELGCGCFEECTPLSRITFGPQSSLKTLGCHLFSAVYSSMAPRLREIRIPDRVETIGERCFYGCEKLSRVIFGECSSLKFIGRSAFSGDSGYGCPLGIIQIPGSVERICGECFDGCKFLSCVIFREASVLRRIGSRAFQNCALKEIRIPDTVTKLGAYCFCGCPLSRVTFSESTSLRRIGVGCFSFCRLVEFSIPKSVELFEGGVFASCPLDDGVTCVEHPHLSISGSLLLSSLNELRICCPVVGALSEVVIPENVESIGDDCFSEYFNLSHVTFSTSSTLKRIGKRAFYRCHVTELLIPSSVVDIGEECFSCCDKLVRVTFSEPSELKKLGEGAFEQCTHLEEIHIPDGVEDLPDKCFWNSNALERVTFGESSFLRRMGVQAFAYCYPLKEIHIPDRVEEICADCFSCVRSPHVTFGEASALKRVHCDAFAKSGLKRISLPPAAVFFGKQ